MPSSRPDAIPTVLNAVRRLRPESLLDIGIGFGKWGHLFREYSDIVASEQDPARYRRENWKVRIDGIEGFAEYVTPMHRYLYDEVHVGDAREIIRTLGRYDVIFLGDVIEHLEKEDGRQLLQDCLAHARKAVVVSTPGYYLEQGPVCANELEVHRSFWGADDFRSLGRCFQRLTGNHIRVAVLAKEPISDPLAQPRLARAVQSLRFLLHPLTARVRRWLRR